MSTSQPPLHPFVLCLSDSGLSAFAFMISCFIFALSFAQPLQADSGLPPERPIRPGTPPPPQVEKERVVSSSQSFALSFPNKDWTVLSDPDENQEEIFELRLQHRNGEAFIHGRTGKRDPRGIKGSLIDESRQAKYLLEYDPETVESVISQEDYTGSALFCGRRRQGPARRACVLVAVALNGRSVVKIHALIDADTPRARNQLQAEVEDIFQSLERLKQDDVWTLPEAPQAQGEEEPA